MHHFDDSGQVSKTLYIDVGIITTYNINTWEIIPLHQDRIYYEYEEN